MEKWNLLIGPQLYLQTYVWDCWMKVKEKEREAHTHIVGCTVTQTIVHKTAYCH